jgi:hypothetical protein
MARSRYRAAMANYFVKYTEAIETLLADDEAFLPERIGKTRERLQELWKAFRETAVPTDQEPLTDPQ